MTRPATGLLRAAWAGEQGHSAVEVAVAAALLGAVLIPLSAFAAYFSLERRAPAYAEALRLAESYAESAPVDSLLAGTFSAAPARHGRFVVTREARTSGRLVSLRVTARRARTGRVAVALERTFCCTLADEPATRLTGPIP